MSLHADLLSRCSLAFALVIAAGCGSVGTEAGSDPAGTHIPPGAMSELTPSASANLSPQMGMMGEFVAGPCDPARCPQPPNECQQAACLANGACTLVAKDEGKTSSTQTTGDCQRLICQHGQVVSIADDSDVPNDTNDCNYDVCFEGVPSNPPREIGAPCGPLGAQACDGSGACVMSGDAG